MAITRRLLHGMIEAEDILLLMGSAPLQWQKSYPTRDQARRVPWRQRRKSGIATTDPNDMLYYFNAFAELQSRSGFWKKSRRRCCTSNSADDAINPPELGIAEKEIQARERRQVRFAANHGSDARPRARIRFRRSGRVYLWELLHSLGR